MRPRPVNHMLSNALEAYDQNVLRLAMNLLRSQEDASDIYQEAFLGVYRNLDISASTATSIHGCIGS